ncbi:hypothetical protein HWV62_2709 [Athelia sp. TMB]|nr:hypothetical protein HWV62_2709 [Athelia sp. TMB]
MSSCIDLHVKRILDQGLERCFTLATLAEVSQLRLLEPESSPTSALRSNAIVRSLTVHAIDTGVVTSVLSITTLILYNFRSTDFRFMAVYFALSKMYATAFLSSLNSRESITRNLSRASEGLSGSYDARATLNMSRQRITKGNTSFFPAEVQVDVHQDVSDNPYEVDSYQEPAKKYAYPL